MTNIAKTPNKYLILKPPSLIDETINTINIPKFETLSKKIKKIITQRSRKNNTNVDFEYKNWWVPEGESLVKKIKQENSTSVKSKKRRKLTPSERKWKIRTERLEAYLNTHGSGKTKRNHKKKKSFVKNKLLYIYNEQKKNNATSNRSRTKKTRT